MRGSLMRLFSKNKHTEILAAFGCNVGAAGEYNRVLGPDRPYKVTRQNVKYWRAMFIDNGGNMAKTDRELREKRVLRKPDPLYADQVFDSKRVYKSILVIPDQHAPYHHRDALAFLQAVADKFQPELTVNLGDELDYHAMSFHDSDPNLDSAGVELEKGKKWLHKLAKLFPAQLVCDSNHGSMAFRKAKHHGLPVQLIRGYREVVFPNGGGDDWHWAESWRVKTPLGDVMFKHQPSGGILVDAAHNSCNLVVGHHHGNYSVEYTASSTHLYYGMYSGCLIDKDAYAFAYGKHSLRKPVIGCSVIIDGRPTLVPMVLNKKGRWNGSL
ncbi:phosphoesterase [Pseudomonas phage Bf7]|uniref:Phosphoesterase n=1 Tax=Pseudomonas phage Bf7 TaxID=1100790 RepID=H2ELW2_9CAUD|nr:phosphoesterase [Pseudomonas phage Bf7]AEX65864.1 phosphoesterase [Pseudomonas phage Bf7]